MPPSSERPAKRNRWVWVVVALLVALSGIAAYLRSTREPEPRPSPVKPIPYRTALVTALSQEALLQTIDKLADWDDREWIRGSMGDGVVWLEDTYKLQRHLIPRLNRVRKLLAEPRPLPAAAVNRLKEKLLDGVEAFDRAWKSFHTRQTGRLRPEDRSYTHPVIFSPAAAYLLSELGVYDALPLMAKVYETKGRIPANRIFLWCAMDVLAVNHPREALSPQAVKALDAYLAAARAMPRPKLVRVPAWNSAFDEDDVLVKIAGQDIGLDKQPQVHLHYYPFSLAKLEADDTGRVDPVIDAHFARLKAFISLAYPQAEPAGRGGKDVRAGGGSGLVRGQRDSVAQLPLPRAGRERKRSLSCMLYPKDKGQRRQ